ncbi:MAG: hypothetical protein ACR2IK_23310 [Chloroflexota bacterium]
MHNAATVRHVRLTSRNRKHLTVVLQRSLELANIYQRRSGRLVERLRQQNGTPDGTG